MSTSPATLSVPFAPRLFDKVWAILLVLVGLELVGMGALMLVRPPMSTLGCDRAKGDCVLVAPGIVGSGRPNVLPIASLANSRVVERDHGGWSWVVGRDGRDIELGPRTTDPARIDAYRRVAAELQAFLQDTARASFATSYTGIGGPPGWLFLLVGLVLGAGGLKWIHGWRADLLFDRDAGTMTIDQRPTFFLSPRRRTVSIADIAGIDAVAGGMIVGLGTVNTATLIVRGADGQPLFRRRMVLDNKSRASIQARYEEMRAFLGLTS